MKSLKFVPLILLLAACHKKEIVQTLATPDPAFALRNVYTDSFIGVYSYSCYMDRDGDHFDTAFSFPLIVCVSHNATDSICIYDSLKTHFYSFTRGYYQGYGSYLGFYPTMFLKNDDNKYVRRDHLYTYYATITGDSLSYSLDSSAVGYKGGTHTTMRVLFKGKR